MVESAADVDAPPPNVDVATPNDDDDDDDGLLAVDSSDDCVAAIAVGDTAAATSDSAGADAMPVADLFSACERKKEGTGARVGFRVSSALQPIPYFLGLETHFHWWYAADDVMVAANKKRLRAAIAINDEWELEHLLSLPEAALLVNDLHDGVTPLMRAAAKRRHKIVGELLRVSSCIENNGKGGGGP